MMEIKIFPPLSGYMLAVGMLALTTKKAGLLIVRKFSISIP